MSIDPTLLSALAIVVERSMNTALKYDPASRSKLQAIAPSTIAIDISDLRCQLVLRLQNNGNISVALYQPSIDSQVDVALSQADVALSGALTDFISQMLSSHQSLAHAGISVSGKVQVLSALKDVIAQLDIDWEEPLVESFGIVPGHALAQMLRATSVWGKSQSQQISQWLPETLQEELRLVPSAIELEHFSRGIDTLRAATQRIEARTQRLKNTLLSSRD